MKISLRWGTRYWKCAIARTSTSVSTVRITTVVWPFIAACLTCSNIRVSASSCVQGPRSSLFDSMVDEISTSSFLVTRSNLLRSVSTFPMLSAIYSNNSCLFLSCKISWMHTSMYGCIVMDICVHSRCVTDVFIVYATVSKYICIYFNVNVFDV